MILKNELLLASFTIKRSYDKVKIKMKNKTTFKNSTPLNSLTTKIESNSILTDLTTVKKCKMAYHEFYQYVELRDLIFSRWETLSIKKANTVKSIEQFVYLSKYAPPNGEALYLLSKKEKGIFANT